MDYRSDSRRMRRRASPCAVLLAIVTLLLCAAAMPAECAEPLVAVAPHQAVPLPRDASNAPPLLGYLARPDGPGPFPAVVVLHWCSGFGAHDTQAAEMLKSWGYVALALDSLGKANFCQTGGGAAVEAIDAYAGLQYLTRLPYVAAGQVAVMGYSMGATATLDVVEQGLLERGRTERFRAAVAWYPGCIGSTGVMAVPTLVLIGSDDDWTPAGACQRMAARQSDIGMTRQPGGGAKVTLVVYPGVTHAFDAPGSAHRYLGHLIRPDAQATADAARRTQAFLHEMLGSP